MEKITINNYASLMNELIQQKSSFIINNVDVDDMLEVCADLENAIEAQCLTCRIYTKGRLVAGLLSFLSYRVGVASIIGIAIHNCLTYNPDYEIARDIANGRILVNYQNKS
ncbi:hypothetical protein VQ643_15270 [Pseudomonas sp. F1_0610]|uniref:hypothetical protein n=1 Tax=Pseudomonas sp. F1_0610 TaxID=3114284 RepID=UPI0039C07CE5